MTHNKELNKALRAARKARQRAATKLTVAKIEANKHRERYKILDVAIKDAENSTPENVAAAIEEPRSSTTKTEKTCKRPLDPSGRLPYIPLIVKPTKRRTTIMAKAHPTPSVEAILRVVTYNPDTGKFHWVKNGKPACKYRRQTGYRAVRIDGKDWLAHRVAHKVVHNVDDTGMDVDHINNIRDDNRIENLRLVPHKENMRNRTRNNYSRHTGVTWNKATKKWIAQIWANKTPYYLGLHEYEENARVAYARARARKDAGLSPV